MSTKSFHIRRTRLGKTVEPPQNAQFWNQKRLSLRSLWLDRLAAIAESRRNASLCEIERRRAVLGDAEFKVIETTPAKGRNAA
jgi:hypothetical protein